MATNNFVGDISATLNQSANARNIFGDPFMLDNKTILPVAKISYGFGGGMGRSKKQDSGRLLNKAFETEEAPNEGSGGGGGLVATARGVFEITPGRTRFIPAFSFRHFALGVVTGLLLKTILSVGKRKR